MKAENGPDKGAEIGEPHRSECDIEQSTTNERFTMMTSERSKNGTSNSRQEECHASAFHPRHCESDYLRAIMASESQGLEPIFFTGGVMGYHSEINGPGAMLSDFKPTRAELMTLGYHYLDRHFAVEEIFATGNSGSWEIRESPFTWRRFCSIAEAISPDKPIEEFQDFIDKRQAEVDELYREIASEMSLESTAGSENCQSADDDCIVQQNESVDSQSESSLTTFYLCRIRYALDDVPVFLTSDYQSAIEMAETMEWNVDATGTMGGCTPMTIDIITFIDGRPISQETIRDRDDEKT